jgi:hypothetical protein
VVEQRHIVAPIAQGNVLQKVNERRGKARQRRRGAIIQRQLQEKAQGRKFDRLIKAKKFQEILDLIVDGTQGTLTASQAETMIRTIHELGKHTLKIDTDVEEKIIMVNPTSYDFLTHILTNGLIVEEGVTYGSDVIDNLLVNQIENLRIEKLKPPPKAIANKDGRFFPYINTTSLNLERYQIYSQEQAYNLKEREHCLLKALTECGISQALINEVKLSFVTGCNFAKKNLKAVATIIGKNIVLHQFKKNGKIGKTVFKASGGPLGAAEHVAIAIHESHYFVFDDTLYSKFFISNYDELKDVEDAHSIVRKGRSGTYRRDDTKKVNSLIMVDKLLKAGFFEKLDMSQFEEASSHQKTREHVYLNNIENEQRPVSSATDDPDKDKLDQSQIFYADCETFVNGGADREKHELYLLGHVGSLNDRVIIHNVCDKRHQNQHNSAPQDAVHDWLNMMTKGGKQDCVVYFHNLKYDYHVLEQYLNIKKKCQKDGVLYNVVASYKKAKIELRDSYKLAAFSLSTFNKIFNLGARYSKKEAIAYNYYTKENNDLPISIEDYLSHLTIEERETFKQNMKDEPTYNKRDKTFNPTSYYKDYLKLDCLVLKKGLQKFDASIGEITNNRMSIYDSLTISSLTDQFMNLEGAYEGVHEIRGNLRAYTAKAVYGGRVCVNEKYKKKVITGKISDYDGVSLYPSGINRWCREGGIPMGKAKLFEDGEYNTWNEKFYSIMTVKITKVNKHQQMPFIAHKTEEGSINYTNTPPVEDIVIDSTTLQDYIEFHEIEYEILDGVYWDEGGNKKMGEVIGRLFEARLKYKVSNPALANILKLMMNSSYGKTIIKKTKTKIDIVKTGKYTQDKTTGEWVFDDKNSQFESYIYNNFNTIKEYRQLSENTYEVKKLCADNTYNRGHIGCGILSMSKRIMNEVFDVANDNGYTIYYTDTDSLHCNFEDVPKLEAKYKEKYGKTLNGKNLEQFHTDFDLKGADGEIYATKSIFLGKKSYYDKLECVNTDGAIVTGSHVRLKGITEAGMNEASKRYINGFEGLYEDLAKGTKVKMILNPFDEEANKQHFCFEFHKGVVRTRKEFSRTVKF